MFILVNFGVNENGFWNMKRFNYPTILEAVEAGEATTKDDDGNRIITKREKLIVCILFVNGANYYLQTKDTDVNAMAHTHHIAKEKVKIADTDIAIMNKLIKIFCNFFNLRFVFLFNLFYSFFYNSNLFLCSYLCLCKKLFILW